MSIRVMTWVLDKSPARLGDRLVLLALADHAKDDGTWAWPSVATLAAKAHLSERQTRTCLRNLEAAGSIRSRGPSRAGTTVYDVIMAPPAKTAPPEKSSTKGRQNQVQLVADTAPEPSTEPSTEPPGFVRAPERVDRKLVTADEHRLTDAILAHFNAQANTKYSAVEFRRAIIGRIREHPDLKYEDHVALIVRNFAAPWWKDAPTPAVIYGNASVFERALHATGKRATKRGGREERNARRRETIMANRRGNG